MTSIKHKDLPIHLCDWSGQPDIHIYCDDSWTTPAWDQSDDGDPPGCWLTHEDPPRKYTFDWEKVNCKACKDKAK